MAPAPNTTTNPFSFVVSNGATAPFPLLCYARRTRASFSQASYAHTHTFHSLTSSPTYHNPHTTFLQGEARARATHTSLSRVHHRESTKHPFSRVPVMHVVQGDGRYAETGIS